MKKVRTSLLTLLILLVATMCLVFGACTGSKSTVEIKFETNGGTAIASITAEIGEEVDLPTPSEREGYIFDGWYGDSAWTGSPITKVVAEEDRTFYAKWTEMPAIELDLNGGSLSVGTKLYLKAGENVYNFMQKYVPARSGLEFGAWFLQDGFELSTTTTMPGSGMKLIAEYKVEYTVEVYLQNAELNGYEKGESQTGKAYFGKSYTPNDVTVAGYEKVANDNAVETLTLSENASSNVFKFYFNRRTLSLVLDPNFPEGSGATGEVRRSSFLYGTETELPSDLYSVTGYLFAGWGTEKDGPVVYASDFLSGSLFNGTGASEATKVVLDNDTYLYAIWLKGYTDLFGGNDYIYILDEAATDIYLSRGACYFKGSYKPAAGEFAFAHPTTGDYLVEGKLLENGTFVYFNQARGEYTASLYRVGVGLDRNVQIALDNYNGIEYYEFDENNRSRKANGTYVLDENGYYIVTFDSTGTLTEMNGQTVVMVLGTVSDSNGGTQNAFQIRNDTEYNMGTLLRFAINGSSLVYYRDPYYTIVLDGFGVATYSTGSSTTNYYYTLDGDVITLINGNGQPAGTLHVMVFGGTLGYMLYDETLDITYTAENGATLDLDGVYQAVYKNGTTEIEGVYSVAQSVMGGYIVTLTYADEETKTDKQLVFLAKTVTTTSVDGKTTETSYVFEQRYVGYAEYYYSDANGTYYTPFVVLNETGEGQATVYGTRVEGNSRVFEAVLYGTYAYNEETDRYVFVKVGNALEKEGIGDTPIDLYTIESFTFSIAIKTVTSLFGTSYYPVTYWHSYTMVDGETFAFDSVVYEGENGATLTTIGGFAIYNNGVETEEGKKIIVGTLTTSNGITILAPVPNSSEEAILLEIDEENKTFVVLTGMIGTLNALLTDGTATRNETLSFDGKGNAIYTIVTPATDDEEAKTVTYEGKYREGDGITSFGDEYFTFEAEGMTFDFMILSTSSAAYFTRYNKDYNGRYNSADGATLEIDGFGFRVRYSDAEGNVYEAIYNIPEENVIRMVFSGGYMYFDLKEGKTFTARGFEYGAYLLVDNQGFGGVYLSMDGYGKLEVFTSEMDEEGNVVRKDIDVNGKYEFTDNHCVLTYKDGNKDVTIYGAFGYMQLGSNVYNAFLVAHEEVVNNYVNEADWSVLSLNSYGTAIRYMADGGAEIGSYILITESMLYYVNSAGNYACIYRYDTVKGTATPVTFSARGYYTEDLEGLIFTQYGYMIYNGQTRYYYDVLSNGDVMIYHQDVEDPNANRYGFVEENFGRFTETKTFLGEEYVSYSGYGVTFQRKNDETKYPVPYSLDADGNMIKYPLGRLQFQPTGAATFSVRGTVDLNGSPFQCTVTRYETEEGGYAMRLIIGTNFYYDITVTYLGETGSIYEVTRMQRIATYYSDTYLTNYYVYAMYGYSLPNSFGVMQISWEYDVEGEAAEPLLTAAFGSNGGVSDINGNVIEYIEGAKLIIGENGIYSIEYKNEATDENGELIDPYTYRLYFTVATNRYTSMPAYKLYGFVRVQTLETEDGAYTVELERIIGTDYNMSAGAFLSIKVTKKGAEEPIAYEVSYTRDGKMILITRERGEDKKILSSKFYAISIENDIPEGVETVTVVPAVKSVAVEEWNVETIYSKDGKSLIDVATIDGEKVVLLFSTDGEKTLYIASNCTYDEATNTYSFTSGTKSFTAKVTDGDLVITDVTPEQEEA